MFQGFKVGQVLMIPGHKYVRGDRVKCNVKVKVTGLYTNHVLTEKVETGIRESYQYNELKKMVKEARNK